MKRRKRRRQVAKEDEEADLRGDSRVGRAEEEEERERPSLEAGGLDDLLLDDLGWRGEEGREGEEEREWEGEARGEEREEVSVRREEQERREGEEESLEGEEEGEATSWAEVRGCRELKESLSGQVRK